MTKVIGVRFRTAGKIYYFDPTRFEINKGDHVIVETARGVEYGTVVGGIREVDYGLPPIGIMSRKRQIKGRKKKPSVSARKKSASMGWT